MKLFHSFSIRALILGLASLMMLFSIGFIVYASKRLHAHEIGEARFLTASVTDRIHNDQVQLLSGVEQLVTTISFLPAVQNHNKPDSEHLFSVLVAKNSAISNIQIASPNGTVWASALPLTTVRSVADKAYFKNALASGRFSSGEYSAHMTQEPPTLGFAHPVKNSSGDISDIIIVTVPLETYGKRNQDKLTGPVFSTLLVDRNGTILYSSINSELSGKQEKPDIFVKMAAHPDGGTIADSEHSGTQQFFSYRSLRLKHEAAPYMYILTGLDSKHVMGSSFKQVGYMATALSFLFLISFGIAFYVVKKGIFDKLAQLQGAADRIVQGDFSERIKIEKALRASEQRFRSFVENATDVVFALTPSGTFSYVSPQLEESLGYELSDVLGKTFTQFVHPDDVSACYEFVALTQDTGRTQRGVEFRALHKNGTWLWFTVNGSRIIDQDGVASIIGIGRDITEHRLVQNELIKAQKLESISILAGGIAHNFNNVLTGVIGYISFAKKHLKDPDKVLPLLEAAEKSSFRAASLARQLLTFSKGGVPFRKQISAENLVQESISLFLSGSNVKGRIDNRAIQEVNVDSEQINQAFNNIVLNSIHSMPDGGVLTVRIEDLQLKKDNIYLLKPGSYVKIAFEDSGCGIEQEHLLKVFDPYFTTRTHSTGLGLSTTHSIITKHDGHIDIVSEINRGTIVTVMLPGVPNINQEEAGKPGELVDNPAGVSVLIMDDEEDIRNLVFSMLSEAGYQVQTCCNGEEAVEQYKKCWKSGAALPIVILDLQVPAGMGGDEAAKHILSIDPHARLIVSSGYSHDLTMADGTQNRFCATLLKPYNTDSLIQVIQRVQQIT